MGMRIFPQFGFGVVVDDEDLYDLVETTETPIKEKDITSPYELLEHYLKNTPYNFAPIGCGDNGMYCIFLYTPEYIGHGWAFNYIQKIKRPQKKEIENFKTFLKDILRCEEEPAWISGAYYG